MHPYKPRNIDSNMRTLQKEGQLERVVRAERIFNEINKKKRETCWNNLEENLDMQHVQVVLFS